MIFSEKWLREWVDPQVDTAALAEQLTMAGLEAEGYVPVAADFSGVVVGEVVAVEPHPDADKLSLCRVTDGEGEFRVVCGASNVRAGMKVPFARLGARLTNPDGAGTFEIKAAKLRGIESNGMLCSGDELGMEESSNGLLELPADAPVGDDLRSFLALDDYSIELDLTPNRGDCLSVAGLAREVGALNNINVCIPDVAPVKATIEDSFAVTISAADGCPRYLGRVIRNIDSSARTPLWMKERLRRCGLRSIDPVVDVTNYVLIELGQPMHAFDLEKLDGAIDVRMAKPGESITLLDGKQLEMSDQTLVIADESGAVAMAGIMGGVRTAVSRTTTNVFLECAYFAPLAISGRARGYGLHTDASHRYERGVDYELQRRATERATGLLLDIVGGDAGPITEARGNLPASRQIALRFDSVPRHLGIELSDARVEQILNALGFESLDSSAESITVSVPSWRFDAEIEADLIEEVARVHGYQNIPSGTGLGVQTLAARSESKLPVSRLKAHLASLGYQEVVTYSFIEPALSALVCGSGEKAIELRNPISSDMSVMRNSILPGLLHTLRYNENRQQGRVRLFETGLVFRSRGEGFDQPGMVAGLLSGYRLPENWNNNKEINDFYDVKGDVESLLGSVPEAAAISFESDVHPALHAGQCAAIVQAGRKIGHVGALDPAVQLALGVKSQVYLFELLLEPLLNREIPRAEPLSRYPAVTRDLAVLVNNETPAADILATVCETAGEFLSDLRIFDVYQGDAIETGKKSIAMGLTWQHPSRNLNDDEVNRIISRCIKALEEKFEARLRTAG